MAFDSNTRNWIAIGHNFRIVMGKKKKRRGICKQNSIPSQTIKHEHTCTCRDILKNLKSQKVVSMYLVPGNYWKIFLTQNEEVNKKEENQEMRFTRVSSKESLRIWQRKIPDLLLGNWKIEDIWGERVWCYGLYVCVTPPHPQIHLLES